NRTRTCARGRRLFSSSLMPTESGEVTRLLRASQRGDQSALDRLLPLVYKELRKLAAHQLRNERPDHTLQATALVHEAYLRMAEHSGAEPEDRAHFIGPAAQVMRHILVDHARTRHRAKRGGRQAAVSLEDALTAAAEQPAELVALDEALETLAHLHARQARV